MLSGIRRLFAKKPPQPKANDDAQGNQTGTAGEDQARIKPPEPILERLTPLPPTQLASRACPYCGVLQEPPPKRHEKCQDCEESIYIWVDQETLVTHFVTNSQFMNRQREAWGDQWANLDKRVREALRSSDWGSLSAAYFRQALLLYQRGLDHRRTLQESRKAELRRYGALDRDMGATRVRIMAGGDEACSECSKNEGREMSIGEALQAMPIPVTSCQNGTDENLYGGWCRCSFELVPFFG